MDNQIFNESCLETLSRMPDNFLGTVITSPPYNMNLRIRNGKYCSRQIVRELSTKYDNFSDNLPIEDYLKFHCDVIDELLRTSNRVFYVIQIVTGSKRAIFQIIGKYAESLKDIIIWDKKVGQPAIGENILNRQTELVLIFEKDYPISRQFRGAPFKRGTLSDIWRIGRGRSATENHRATFPEELVEKILESFTDPDELIYDPFLGTGTTAVVAKKMGRRYIGSEIDADYFEVANKRLQ